VKKVLIINPANYGRNSAFRPPFGLMTIAAVFSKSGVEGLFFDIDLLRLKNSNEETFAEILLIKLMCISMSSNTLFIQQKICH